VGGLVEQEAVGPVDRHEVRLLAGRGAPEVVGEVEGHRSRLPGAPGTVRHIDTRRYITGLPGIPEPYARQVTVARRTAG